MKLGVFGGTFNPIHFGHLRAAEEVREALGLEKVLFIPSGNPPLKNLDIADARHRYAMVETAVSGNPHFEVLDIECASPKKSYTLNTIERLNQIHAGSELYFILGIDAFLDLPNWYMPDRLVSIINFALVSRPVCRFADLVASPYLPDLGQQLKELDRSRGSLRLRTRAGREAVLVRVTDIAIASTDIRRRVKEGLSIKYMLPAEVESFIISDRVYFPDGREKLRTKGRGTP